MIRIRNLTKEFVGADTSFKAVEKVSLDIVKGEVFGIIGSSGAGKSTLLRCLNLLEMPSEGSIFLDGQDISALSVNSLKELRSQVGMIFQGFNLLMQSTALENVCLPLKLMGMPKKTAIHHGLSLLELVGLGGKQGSYPSQLSGGMKQRVAIARALAPQPKVLLCDEATSALDTATTMEILKLLKDINEKTGVTIILVTHQMSVVKSICHRVAVMENGKIMECDTVEQVFNSPQSSEAKRLIECDNMCQVAAS